jgi:hypothetical protein
VTAKRLIARTSIPSALPFGRRRNALTAAKENR